jgi:hypothetical protein
MVPMTLPPRAVHRASSPLLPWLALVGLALAVGCNPPTPPINVGPQPQPPGSVTQSARVVLSLPPGAPASEVTRVDVTLSAADLAARSTSLVLSGSTWNGVFSDVPAGSARAVSAEAFDSLGHKRFAGRADNLTVTAGQELVVSFTLQSTDGRTEVEASVNRRPVLTGLSASPSRVDVGQTTTVTANVSDPEGEALTYQWSATGCSGSLEDTTSASARFTPDARPSGDVCGSCLLSFLATDARGAQARGSLGLCVGPSPSVSLAPQVVDTDIGDTSVGPGQHVQLGVRAWDPQGSALTFSWELTLGRLYSGSSSTATTTEAVWVVPTCLPASHPQQPVRVVVRNAQGQTATAVFPIFYDRVPTCNAWAATGAMNQPRQGHTATLLGSGLVLVTGGTDGTGPLNTAELYDPSTGLWTPTGTMTTPRAGHTATRLEGDRVLVVGGYSATPPQSLTSAEIYDPITREWSPTTPMDTRRYWHTATRLSWGGVLITGGLNGYDQLSNVELYLPSSDTWIYQGYMHAIRYQHTATLLEGDRVLVAGGKGTASDGAEVYDYMSGRFTFAGNLSQARSRHTATSLPDGRVLVIGGEMEAGPTDSAELYEPTTQTWAPVRSMSEPRTGHTATLLPNDKVLIAGGNDGGGTLGSSELYDPATDLWSPANTLVAPTEGHTALLLGTGVLSIGGSSAGAPSAASALYTYTP